MCEEFDTPETTAVASILRQAGLTVEPVNLPPPAQNPDLKVRGSTAFWGEVKSLANPPEMAALDHAWEYLRPHVQQHGIAIALHTSLRAADGYGRLRQLIDANSAQVDPAVTVFLAPEWDLARRASYVIEMEEGGRHRFDGFLSSSGRPVVPWWSGNPRHGQQFELTINGQRSDETLIDYEEEVLIGATLSPNDGQNSFSASPAGGAWNSTDVKRLRRQAAVANEQISSACETEILPGAVFLVGRISADTLAISMLGDLTVSFPRNNLDAARSFYGRNGVFRRDRNRHLSCAYAVNGERVIYLRNPFAHRELANTIPGASIVEIDENCKVTLPG
jgi:hypothetical protein